MRSVLLHSIDKRVEQFIKNPHRYSWEIKQEKWIDNILMAETIHLTSYRLRLPLAGDGSVGQSGSVG